MPLSFHRRSLSYWRDLIFRKGNSRYCPICQHKSLKFTAYGVVPRKEARCPWCGSLERHRAEWLYLIRKTDLFNDHKKKILHIAPEPCLEILLQRCFGSYYITADLYNLNVMIRMDVMNIPFFSNYFDVLLSSHVLLDVSDDRKALSEYHRILKPEGYAIILEDIHTDKTTFKDPLLVNPIDRLREYGGPEHVRRYSADDFIDRLRKAGFLVKTISVNKFADPTELIRYGMTKAVDDIYLCAKPNHG